MRRRLRDGRDGRAIVEDLERIGEGLPPGPEKSHWFLELGVACEMLVPERQRALALYLRAVEIDPANSEAIDRGRLVCRELNRLDELIRLVEADLERERDEERRERLTALIGEALLDSGNRNRAAGFLVAAAGQFPASLTIQDALGTVGYDDDWKREVDRLIGIGDSADPDSGARVSLRAARILRMEAPEDERYEALLQRVLDYDEYNESAFQLLDAHFATAGRWDDLEQQQDRLVVAFPGKEEQSALSQRFAFSWIARGQHDRAARWCWRAIELGGLVYPIAGLTMLRGIYGSRRAWDELLRAVDALLSGPLDDDAMVHTALLGGTIAWKAKRDLERARGYFDRVRRVAIDSLLLIDFDDAQADARNPETIGEEQRALIDHARKLAKQEAPSSIDRVLEAWRKAIAVDPNKRAPRRALARLLQRAERWRTLADALKDEEQHACSDDAERVALLFQLAALYRDRLRQDLLLTQTLQRILELSPGNLAALDQLEAAFTQMRRWPDVAATLEKKRAYVTDASERLGLQLQLASLYQEKLNNESEAVKALEGAFALDPGRADIVERLAGSYGKRREWDKLFALKRERARTLVGPEAQLAAALELAQLATDKLKKAPLAIEAWSAVLAIDGNHDGALAALEKLYAVAEEHEKLAAIYSRRAEQTGDPATQLAYLVKLAQLLAAELSDAPRAIDAWQTVLSLSPGHGRALAELKRLYVAARAWDPLESLFSDEKRLDECARLFVEKAPEMEPAVQVELLLRAGRIFGETLGRRDQAQRVYERVLALDVKSGAATTALIKLYEEANDARKLAQVLALQIAHQPPGPASDPNDSVAVGKARLLRLAGLHARELHDAPGAFGWQLRAFVLDPRDDKLRPELERLAARVNGWRELVAAYESVCAAQPDVDRVALLSVVAREKEAALGDVDGALATWQELAALEPPPPPALAALARIYEARQAWRELHDVYARKLTLAHDADTRRPIVIAMAALAERQGDDRRAIIDYRQLIHELGPDAATLAALERLYERAGELEEVDKVLLQWRQLPASPSERTALDHRLAETRRRLGRFGEAITLYGEVLSAQPNHAGARAALESIADGDDHALEAALLLEPILRATGASERLARVLRIRIQHAGDVNETVALMHELAWLYERELGRRDDAFATLADALKTDPAHTPTFDALERLSDGKWERLAALYKEVAVRPLSISEHVEVRCRLGALYRDKLLEPERALATFNRVLDLAPDNERAEQAIDALLGASGRHVERAERLKAFLARNPDDTARALKLAGLYERELADAAQAAQLYRELCARDAGNPGNGEAFAGLERLFAAGPPTLERAPIAALLLPRYREAGRVADVVRVWAAAPEVLPVEELATVAQKAGELATLRSALGAAATRASDVRVRAGLRRAHALLERDRGEPAAAESLLRLALTDWPEDLASLRALDALLAAQGRAQDRIDVLGRLAAIAPVDDKPALLLQRGELQTQLGDVQGARDTLGQALDLGDDPRPLAALARLADDDAAIELWQRLKTREPGNHEALAALASLYERHERWRDLADVLEEQLHVPGQSPGAWMVPLYEQQALVWMRLDEGERAIATWKRLLEIAPDAVDAWRALARLYRARDRHEELRDVLVNLIDKLPRAERLPVAVQLAELVTDKLARHDEAQAAWRRVLELDAQHEEARQFFARHNLPLPAVIDPAAAIAELTARASGVALLDLLAARAEAAEDRAQQLAIFDALAEQAVRMERWARAVEATRRAAELEPPGTARAQRLYRAGVMCRDQLADFDEALACFEAAARCFGAAGAVAPQPLDDAIARLRARGARAAGQT